MRLPWAKTWYEKCPDGTRELVHRNPQDAIPLFAGRNFETSKAATADMVQELSLKVDTQVRAKVQGFMVHIDKSNASMQTKLCLAYAHYQQNPCNNREWFRERIDKIMGEETMFRLKQFDEDLSKLRDLASNSPKQVPQEVDRVTKKLTTPAAKLERQLAFDEVQDQTLQWNEGHSR